jgi:hypothetical protein
LLAVKPQYDESYISKDKAQDDQSRLFEILGIDVLIDKNLKAWILEVNKDPSLELTSSFDASHKLPVLKGAFHI